MFSHSEQGSFIRFIKSCFIQFQRLVVIRMKTVTTYVSPNFKLITFEPAHEITNNKVCATSKATDQPAHKHSLIRDFASRLSIL